MRSWRGWLLGLSGGVVVALAVVSWSAGEQTASAQAKQKFFTARIAPVLQSRCLECHGGSKPRGGLDLTTRTGILHGSDNGPVVVPGQADKSLLIQMVSPPQARMPKRGDTLTGAQVADLRQWIDDGAAWPADVKLVAGQDWWSVRPLSRPQLPEVKNAGWVRTPIDAFILAMMEAKGLSPAPEVDRVTFLRRAKFDLHGLPPTPEEIEAFVNDEAPGAFERLVDRLLASPLYGERWGRYWLDIAHYADTHGFDKDKRRLWAWFFRDWVIRAFNRDLPYRRFARLQIAGDVILPDDPEGIIATGFVAAGPWDFVGHVELREGTVDKMKTRLLDRDDMVANTMSTFLSITAHCARCHDHPFDPIPQKEYYQLQAVFAGVERGDRVFLTLQAKQTLLALQKEKSALIAHSTELAKIANRLAALDKQMQEIQSANKVYAVLPIPPRPIHRLHRGDVEKPKELVMPGALSLIPGWPGDLKVVNPQVEGNRRLALANWVTDDRNVLAWRSIVNRIWQYHFGRGLVDTPNDFGKNGSRPTHAELLDWLAVEFRDGGQSFKKLHRMILLSSVYRQASTHNAANAKIDGDNRFLWKMNRRKLDAEAVRDSVLAVSGKLNYDMGGPGYALFRFKDDHSPIYDHSDVKFLNDPSTYRRTVYRFVVRSVPNPFLECMDCADPNISVPRRNETLTALQALALLNNPFMVQQSVHFAQRLEKYSADPERQIEMAFRLAFGRLPTSQESAAVSAYARRHGLVNTCRLLFNTNEFLFVD